jgi:hypothetical protein
VTIPINRHQSVVHGIVLRQGGHIADTFIRIGSNHLQLLPITLLPIAGKTLRALADPINPSVNWLTYLILPMLLAVTLAVWFARKAKPAGEHPAFIRNALLFCTWVYFGLNYAFFGFPLLWEDWGGRTPNAVLFFIAAAGLTLAALFFDPGERRWTWRFRGKSRDGAVFAGRDVSHPGGDAGRLTVWTKAAIEALE